MKDGLAKTEEMMLKAGILLRGLGRNHSVYSLLGGAAQPRQGGSDMKAPLVVAGVVALLAFTCCCGGLAAGTLTPDPFSGYRQVNEWKGIAVDMTTAEMFEVLAPQESIVRWQDPVNPDFRIVHEFFEDTLTGERCIVVIRGYVPEGGDEWKDDATILIVEELWVK
jgi:hypothetical protein